MATEANVCLYQTVACVFNLMHYMGESTDWLLSVLYEIDFAIRKLPLEEQLRIFSVAGGLFL